MLSLGLDLANACTLPTRPPPRVLPTLLRKNGEEGPKGWSGGQGIGARRRSAAASRSWAGWGQGIFLHSACAALSEHDSHPAVDPSGYGSYPAVRVGAVAAGVGFASCHFVFDQMCTTVPS